MTRGWSVLLGSLASVACSPAPADPGAHDPGLVLLAQREQPTPGPHLAELRVHEAGGERLLYVANSNDVFAVYALGEGGLELLVDRVDGGDWGRCTTMAIHEGSANLYCGNDDVPWVRRYSLADPRAPQLQVEEPPTPMFAGLGTRDIEVVGDHLYFARSDFGLAWAAIGADGSLGPEQTASIVGNVRLLAGAGDRLWALTADRGLLMLRLDPQTGAPVELDQLALAGPALDLGLDEGSERAIVALGSQGAAIVSWDGSTLGLEGRMLPPGVVSAADLEGDAAAVITLTGAYLYDLRADALQRVADRPGGGWIDDEPPIAGFVSAGGWDRSERSGSMNFARFSAGELLISDWTFIERLGVNLDGYPLGIDIQRAAYHGAAEAEVAFGVRNPGSLPQRLEVLSVGGERLDAFTLGPFETRAVTLDAARFEVAVPELLPVQVYDGFELVADVATVVLRRPTDAEWPVLEKGAPAPGDRFPKITVGRGPEGAIEPVTIPAAGLPQRVVFFGSDCVAMWAEVEDLIWRLRVGDLAGTGAFLESFDNLAPIRTARWQLDGLPWGFSSPDDLPPEIVALNPWELPYDQAFN
ncbi:MAG: hypothetical protein KC431_00715, partial [Myxococcales bacterium]|nr:hypothetical protein [Myxococcales bacterium]